MLDAISRSRNIPSILLAEEVGMDVLARRWSAMGLTSATSLPSASLGAFEGTPLQMTSAYSAIPGSGQQAAPRFVLGILDVDGAQLDTQTDDTERTRVASPRAAFFTQQLLREVVQSGTGRWFHSIFPMRLAAKPARPMAPEMHGLWVSLRNMSSQFGWDWMKARRWVQAGQKRPCPSGADSCNRLA